MKTRMIIGVTLAVLFLINSQRNIDGENHLSPPSLLDEAIMKFYPNPSFEETGVLMKTESLPYGYEMEKLEHGKKLELEMDQKGNIIHSDSF